MSYPSFTNYVNNMMSHQASVYEMMKSEIIGQVSLPTGSGKSRIQIATILRMMIEMQEKNECGVFVVASHRLKLNRQLMKELMEQVVKNELPFNILTIGSEKFPQDALYSKYGKEFNLDKWSNNIKSTTSSIEVGLYAEKTKNQNRHLICVTTYHSFERLVTIPNIDVCMYDEAHTIVSEEVDRVSRSNFRHNISQVKPKIKFNFFFTATRKTGGEESPHSGMDDIEFYGNVLTTNGKKYSPKAMFDKGVIIPPKVFSITTERVKNGEDRASFTNPTMCRNSIIAGYQKLKTLVNPKLGTKLLVTMINVSVMEKVITSQEFIDFCNLHSIKTFAFSHKGAYMNSVSEESEYVMSQMQSEYLLDTEDALIIHVDMLTEGIDLPSITGVMPFRDLQKIKFLQTIGRGVRLCAEDRNNIHINKTLKPNDLENYVKPYCYVMIPTFYQSIRDDERLMNHLRIMCNKYEIPIEGLFHIEKYDNKSDEDLDAITRAVSRQTRDMVDDLVFIEQNIMERFTTLDKVKNFIWTAV